MNEPPDRTEMTRQAYARKHFRGWKLLLLALLPVISYANIFNNQLFLDDLDNIVNNAYIRDWHYFPKHFTENSIAGAGKESDYYRPFIQSVFTVAYSLWETNPMGYRILSVLFHVLGVFLLFFFLLQLLGDWRLPLVSAALFAVHPAQTEAIDMASALGILSGNCFMLLSCIGYVSSRMLEFESGQESSKFLTIATLFTTALALLSKETMVVIPGFIFLVEFCFLGKEEKYYERLKAGVMRSLPYLAVVAVYITLRFTVLNFGGTGNLYRHENIFTQSWLVRFYTFMTVLLQFMKIIFYPSVLFMERATVTPVYVSFRALPVIAGFFVFAGMTAVSFLASLKITGGLSAAEPAGSGQPRSEEIELFRIIPFGFMWFIFAMVPVSNVLIPISTLIVESWLYTAIMGVILVVCGSLLYLRYKLEKNPYYDVFLCFLLAVVLFASVTKTVRQNRIWKNPIVFYNHTLKYAPESERFHNNLAMAYAENKMYKEAIEQYKLAIQINDQFPETHHNLANTYADMGMLGEAEAEYSAAIRMNRLFYHSYASLSALYIKAGRPDLAESVLMDLILNVPSRWEGYYNLGILYSMKGDKNKALALWKQGLAVDPYNNLLNEAVRSVP